MGEVVAIPDLPDNPAPPQLVDDFHDQVSVQIACLGEQVEGEVRAYRCRETGHLPGGRSPLVQTFAQHRGEITDRERRPVRIGDAARRLDDVQREAARRRMQQVRAGLRERLPGNGLSETRRIGGLQRAERDLGEQPGSPHPDDPACQLGVFVEIVLAQCRGSISSSARTSITSPVPSARRAKKRDCIRCTETTSKVGRQPALGGLAAGSADATGYGEDVCCFAAMTTRTAA
jgi:hypothetical protein